MSEIEGGGGGSVEGGGSGEVSSSSEVSETSAAETGGESSEATQEAATEEAGESGGFDEDTDFVDATSFSEINGRLQDAYLYYHLLKNDEFDFSEDNLKAVLSFGSTYCSESDNSDVGSKLLVKYQESGWTLEAELLALFWGFVCKYSSFMIFTLYELFTETIYQHASEASEPCTKLDSLIRSIKSKTPQQYREYLSYLNSPNSVEHLLLYLSGHSNPFTNSFYITWLLQSYTFNGGMSNGQPISKVLQALLKNITKINGCEKQMIEILLATSDNQALFENILSVFMTALREPSQLEQLCVKYVEVTESLTDRQLNRFEQLLLETPGAAPIATRLCARKIASAKNPENEFWRFYDIVRYLRSLDEDGLLDVRQAVIKDIPSSRCDYLFDEVRRKEGLAEKLGGFFHKK